MPRKKKIEEPIEEITVIEPVKEKKPDYGSGWCRVNNMLQDGYSIEEIRGEGK